ncbi:MAG: hypothetical protein QXP77_02935 [Candidatus Aenigmatarchaeota archaeon]
MEKFEIAIVLLFLVFVSFYFLGFEEEIKRSFSDIFFFSIAFLASFFCFFNYKKFGKSLEGRTWFLLGIGVFFWGLAELIWAYYEIIKEVYPFPSFADVFYVIGYFPMILTTLYYFSYIHLPLKSRKIYLVTLVSLVYGLFSLFFVILPVVTSEITLTEKSVLITYILLDVYLIFSALLLVEAFRGGALSKVWFVISLAFLFTGIADTIYSYLNLKGLYELGSPYDYVDFLWIAGYLCLIHASIYERISIEKIAKRIKRKR